MIWNASMFLPQPVVLADPEAVMDAESRQFQSLLNQIISEWRDSE